MEKACNDTDGRSIDHEFGIEINTYNKRERQCVPRIDAQALIMRNAEAKNVLSFQE